MTRLLQQLFGATIMSLLISTQAMAGTLTSTVNRNVASLNETIRLQVSYDQRVDANSLDRAALEKDFEVLSFSPQSSSSISIVNGQATRLESTVWNITLAAKRVGSFTIPAFQINGDTSKAISIDVQDFTQTSNTNTTLSAKVTTSSRSVVPSEQLIVEVEISAAGDVSNLNGSPLLINNADIEELGQQTFQRIENGIARQIVVIRYAVFAQEAGELVIPIMTYSGIKGARRSTFRSRGQQVIARTKQLNINVGTAQTKDKTAWFPAESVNIEVAWSADISDLEVGTPITRTVTVTAVGQRAEAIPPLEKAQTSPDYKVYNDQPQLEKKTTDNGFISTRMESEAIVPSRAGELVLPELTMHWWNTKTKQWQQAVLPEQILTVSEAAKQATAGNSNSVDDANTDDATPLTPQFALKNINLLLTIFAALMTVICGIQWWQIRKIRQTQPISPAELNTTPPESQSWSQLQQALKKGDASLIRIRLLSWANGISNGTSTTTLHELSKMSDSHDLAKAISQLEAHLYNGQETIDLKALSNTLKSFKQELDTSSTAKKSGTLKPLYQTT